MKEAICTVTGLVGGVVSTLLGGFSQGLTALFICMVIDYVSGLVVAGVFHTSPKTESGALQSNTCVKGIIKKIMVLCLVAIAHRIDIVVGSSYIRDAAIIGFMVNEIISIFENAGLMGIKLPSVMTKAIDILTDKEKETEEK